MKKIFLTGVLSLGLFLGLSNVVNADTAIDLSADSIDIEQSDSEDSEGSIVSFDELSDKEQEHFLKKGFDENDEYFTSKAYMPADPDDLTQAINVIYITASTKKQDSRTAYTEYIITASKAGFLKLDCSLKMGNVKTVTSEVTPFNAPLAYSGGIYSFYNGSSKYMTYKLTIQYTTSYGTGGVGSQSVNAGGVTLGV